MYACRKIQFTRVAQPDDPSAVHSKIVEKTKSHANNDHRYLEYILSVILLMKNNVVCIYWNGNFSEKSQPCIEPAEAKKIFLGCYQLRGKTFQWLRTAGDLRSWPIWPQFLLEKLPALDSLQRILYEVECRDHYCLSVANANIVIQFKIQKTLLFESFNIIR